MKTYQVYIDVTFTGLIEVKAKSKKQAKEVIKNYSFVPSDIRTFSHIRTSNINVEQG